MVASRGYVIKAVEPSESVRCSRYLAYGPVTAERNAACQLVEGAISSAGQYAWRGPDLDIEYEQ